MDRYVKSEPTPEAFAGLLEIPADDPVTTVSVVRVRRDRPVAEIHDTINRWRAVTATLRQEYGCTEDVVARVRATLSGPVDHWDHVIVTRFPTRRSLMRYAMDERILDAIAVRRDFIEENLALVLTGTNLPQPDRLPLSVVPAPPAPSVLVDPLGEAIVQGDRLQGTAPVYLVAVSHYRSDVPREQAEGAYLRWRRMLEEMAPELGMTFPITANIRQVYVGEPQGWDIVNVVRYPDPEAYRASLRHPKLLAGRHLRNLALDYSLLMICQEEGDPGARARI
jgi:hypothetical protein